MTEAQSAHARRLGREFTFALQRKYEAGQAEHGGNLWEKPGMLGNCLEEVIDMFTYLRVAQERQDKALQCLQVALESHGAEKDAKIREAIANLL